MANNPVIGAYICPHCGIKNIVMWNGNYKQICIGSRCHKKFIVKRTKIINAEPVNPRIFS